METSTNIPQETEAQPQQTRRRRKQRLTALGVFSLALAVLAFAGHWVPFLNNIAFFIAVVGALLGFLAIICCASGRRSGMGVSVTAFILNVIAVILVIMVQLNGIGYFDSILTSWSEDGKTVTTRDGLTVTLGEIENVKTDDRSGKQRTRIELSLANDGDDAIAINAWDWRAQNSDGETLSYCVEEDGVALSDFTLEPGSGGVTDIYFDGAVVQLEYYGQGGILKSYPTAKWGISTKQ